MAEVNPNAIKSKLADIVKAGIGKMLIFAFGIFCGIGLSYKVAKETAQQPAPAQDLSVYTKRIEELNKENAALKDALQRSVIAPQPQPVVEPPAPQPGSPPIEYPRPRPGVVIPK